jgi:hypothetical protein
VIKRLISIPFTMTLQCNYLPVLSYVVRNPQTASQKRFLRVGDDAPITVGNEALFSTSYPTFSSIAAQSVFA